MNRLQNILAGSAVLFALCGGAYAAVRSTPVTVVNSEAEPVPVVTEDERNIRTPFAVRVTTPFGMFRGIPTSDRVAGDDFTVPAGQILVVEHISLRATMANEDEIGYVEARFASDSESVTHYLPVQTDTRSLPASSTQKIVSQGWQIRFFADPGSEIILNLNSIAGSPGGVAIYSLSGYLVPNDSPGLGR